MLRIAFDHQIFTSQSYGGISRYFFELSGRIENRSGTCVETAIISPIYRNEYLRKRHKELQTKGIYFPYIPKSGRIVSRINDLISPLLFDSFKPDILHETYYSLNSFGNKNIKRVITVYDMIHELFPQMFSPNDKTSEIKRVAINRAHHIICISESTKRDLIDLFGIDECKISVIHLGFSLISEKSMTCLNREHDPYLLYVGSRGEYKNFQSFIKAYSQSTLLRRECKIIAFGGGAFTKEEMALLADLDIGEGRIIQISGDDSLLEKLYRGAKIFVYPSLYEGFGIPPLEAMSFGCPVACSDTSSIPEVVGGAAALFDPYRVESITHSLEGLYSDSNLLEGFVQKGFEQVKNFSWDKCANDTLEIYKQMME